MSELLTAEENVESVHNYFPKLLEYLQDILSNKKSLGSLVCRKASLTEYLACYSNLKRVWHMLLKFIISSESPVIEVTRGTKSHSS